MPVLFLILWIVLNGKISLEVLVLGILVALIFSWVAYKLLGINREREMKMWKNIFGILSYLVHLTIEIVKAGLGMAKILLASDIQSHVDPHIVYMKSPLRSEISKVALANSITLTPGTITVYLEDDLFVVHAINKDATEGLENSSFVKKLRKLEGGSSS